MVRWIGLVAAAAVAITATALAGCAKEQPPKKEAAPKNGRVVAPPVDYFDKTVPPKAEGSATPGASVAAAPPSSPPKVDSTDHSGDAPAAARENPVSAGMDELNLTARFLGLTAPKPATWILVGSSGSMRKAEYTVPGVGGKDAGEIVVFHFGKDDGGTNAANIDRWTKQFRSAEGGKVTPHIEERLTADGMHVELVELAGEYQAMQGGFKPEQLFLGAIVDAPVGKVFIRFVGPAATVEANREAFTDMLRGMRRVDSAR